MRIPRHVPHNPETVNAVVASGGTESSPARAAGSEKARSPPAWRLLTAPMRPPRTCHTFALAVAASALAAAVVSATAPPMPGLTTITVASVDTDLPIPDSDALVSVLDVAAAGTIVDVDVTLDLAHPQSDQLDVFLVAPSGTTITLTTDNGGGNDDVFAGATFDDQASGTPSAPCVRNFTYVDTIATGPIQPEEAMGALVGELASGPWALVVVDDSGGQTGMPTAGR
jgi:hypothetical protein